MYCIENTRSYRPYWRERKKEKKTSEIILNVVYVCCCQLLLFSSEHLLVAKLGLLIQFNWTNVTSTLVTVGDGLKGCFISRQLKWCKRHNEKKKSGLDDDDDNGFFFFSTSHTNRLSQGKYIKASPSDRERLSCFFFFFFLFFYLAFYHFLFVGIEQDDNDVELSACFWKSNKLRW